MPLKMSVSGSLSVILQEHKLSSENLYFLLGSEEFIPAGNEPSAVLARAFMTIEFILLYGECRVGQIPRSSAAHQA